MTVIKKAWGKIIYGFAKFLEVILTFITSVIALVTGLVKKIGSVLFTIIFMGGFFFLLFIGPRLFMNPLILVAIIILVVFPIIGSKFISFLKYINYTITEYLYDYSDYLVNDKKTRYNSFSEYGKKYRKQEEEKRQKAQQREWEERFRQWTKHQNTQSNNRYEGYSWGGQSSWRGNQTYTNPNSAFKNEYEKSCDLLSVNYSSDKYEIKLAYRKKAKMYHPDLNKAPDATLRFKEIRDAYEFLSDANIERYKNVF